MLNEGEKTPHVSRLRGNAFEQISQAQCNSAFPLNAVHASYSLTLPLLLDVCQILRPIPLLSRQIGCSVLVLN